MAFRQHWVFRCQITCRADLDPRHKALKFLSAETISEVKAELRDQIQQLHIANDTLNLNSESQPPPKKKALDI